MEYLVTGFAELPKEELREMRLLITDLQPGETPEDAFRRIVREKGLQPGTVFEVLPAN